MRRAASTDGNQAEIVAALRKVGAIVTSTSAVGAGFPDLAVGYHGATFLLEVKDSSKPPSARRLTPAQVEWHLRWRGHVAVVLTAEDALRAIGAIGRPACPRCQCDEARLAGCECACHEAPF